MNLNGQDGPDEFELDETLIERESERFNLSPCTQYTELGSTVGLWDWRAEDYELVYYPDNNTTPAFRTVSSPFHTTGTNINHLNFLTNGESVDYEPAEGWELLYRNLGTAVRPVKEPSYGLYNRLDGRIRILFYIEPNDGIAPDNVLIRLSQVATVGTSKVTALFENLNIPANALADFDKGVSIGGIVHLNKGVAGPQWYLLEGVAGYDPCLCQHESSLAVEPVLTEVTSLNFTMEGTGTSSTVYSAGSPTPLLSYLGGLSGKVSAAYKNYKSNIDLQKDIEKNKAAGKTVKVLSTLLGTFSNSLGTVNGVTDLFAFLTGKKSSSPKLTGFNHNFNFEANGTLENNSVYDPYFFYTPGSFYQEGQLQAFRPIYDNPLGIFTVLEAPVVEFELNHTPIVDQDDVEPDVSSIRFRFTGGLRYHINDIAGISNEPVQLLASLVWTGECGNGDNFFATPAINITCLEDFVVEFNDLRTTSNNGTGDKPDHPLLSHCMKPELQIVAVLTSTAPTPGQEILYSARYKTRIQEVPEGTIGENPFAGMTIEEISNSCTNMIPAPISGRSLSRFCEKSYDPDFEKSELGEDVLEDQSPTINEPASSGFAVFPNPFVNHLSVKVKKEWLNTPLQFQLHDVLGRAIWKSESTINTTDQYVIADDFGHLPPGSYLLTVSGKDFVHSIPLQKH
jgi:hypothetical protein